MKFKLFLIIIYCFLSFGQPLFAQYYFGRNKVQYNNFDWHVLKTTHFDIYFYPEMQEIAEMGASFAEKSYKFLENKFNHNLVQPIPLIFYSNHNHFQQTNISPYLIPEGVGGFFEFMKGRVVVPYNGSISDFRRVIQHELVHVFMTSKIQRILKNHRILTYPEVPLWFVEGLAEYWSEGWGTEGEMFIRDAVLNGYLVPVSEMYRINGSYLMYKEGQNILNFIAEKYGEEKILQLMENIWKEDEFSHTMKLTLGVDYREFDEQWTYHLKKEKYPLMESNDFPRMVSVPITARGFSTKPVFYRDGDQPKVIYISNQTGYSTIYMQDLVKLSKKPIKKDALIEGEKTSEFEAFHILKSKIDVSKKGDLVFVSKSGPRDVIYAYNIAERKLEHELGFEDIVTIASPAWDPTGERIVFSASNFGGMIDLYVYDLKKDELKKITNDFYEDRDPVWSPDGKSIIFSSDRTIYGKDGFYNLFLFDIDQGSLHYLTCNRYNDHSPAWSPDGKFISFTSDRDGVLNIWMLNTEDKTPENLPVYSKNGNHPAAFLPQFELKQLTNFTTGAYDPVWTDDGTLLFTALENFSMRIMELKEVTDKFEEAPQAPVDSLTIANSSWEVQKLGSKMITSSLRYRNKFTLDVAQSQITQDPIFGTSGGAQLAVTDMLGNYQYFFLLYNNAQTRDEFMKSFNIAVSRVDLSRRTNFAVGGYHFAGNYYNYAEGFFYERRYGGFASLSYPFSMFSRLEGTVNVRVSNKEWYSSRQRDALLFSNYVSYIKDNSIWGPSGPLDGERYKLTIGNTLDVQYNNANFYTVIADYRRYFRTSLATCFATRITLQYNHGKEALPFFMGGSWDLRGYRLWSVWGEKLFLLSNEFRFPFINYFLVGFPFGGIGFSSIRGALFTDIGNAWDNDLNRLLGSYGFGVRWRLGGVLVLRLDYGKKMYIDNLDGKPELNIRPGTFSQFFFGWDF